MNPFLQVTDLCKAYGELSVLQHLSFEVNKGEYVAIMGASGSGKTTLLQLLGLLDEPQSGTLLLDGQSLLQLRVRERSAFRNKEIGFVFQFHELLPEFSAQENVALPAIIGGKRVSKAMKEAADLLNALNMGSRAAHRPHQLSGGEKQRVAVARALINKPKLLLADEPSGSLDTHNKEDLHKLLDRVKSEWGQTMIIVTHDAELAARADRILYLREGQIVSA